MFRFGFGTERWKDKTAPSQTAASRFCLAQSILQQRENQRLAFQIDKISAQKGEWALEGKRTHWNMQW
ncbi:MAG: hypothetical protein ACLU9S_20045 [Oscillospiraceae bacterium]